MFCRFCGGTVPRDSRFCPHCGRRLAGRSPRTDVLVRTLRFGTPYPYAIAVLVLFAGLILRPGPPPFDYSNVAFDLELLGESGEPESNIYRHHFSLIVENLGDAALTSVPVEVHARVESERPAEVYFDDLGSRIVVLRDQQPTPLGVALDDGLEAAEKRRFPMDWIVIAQPPFTVTYDVVGVGTDVVLASFTGTVGGASPDPNAPAVGGGAI